jgi:hypothetical protein
MKRPILVIALVLSLDPSLSAAACRWEWFCNGEGSCKQMPLCDSVNETPPPKPTSEPPAMPPVAMRPSKLPAPMGALTCEHIMRQGSGGKWKWVEMCYCADESRSNEPSPPFAHIVRCDAPRE